MKSLAVPSIAFKLQTAAEGAKYQYVLHLPSNISQAETNIFTFSMNYIGAFPV